LSANRQHAEAFETGFSERVAETSTGSRLSEPSSVSSACTGPVASRLTVIIEVAWRTAAARADRRNRMMSAPRSGLFFVDGR
jgi:hypothetical protein